MVGLSPRAAGILFAYGRWIPASNFTSCPTLAETCADTGLLVPLGEGFTVADLIVALRCPVLVAARNRLGVINQSLLTLEALRARGVGNTALVLMDTCEAGLHGNSNKGLIHEFGRIKSVFRLPYLGRNATETRATFRGSCGGSRQ